MVYVWHVYLILFGKSDGSNILLKPRVIIVRVYSTVRKSCDVQMTEVKLTSSQKMEDLSLI